MFVSARLCLTLAAPVVLVATACSDTRPTAPEQPLPRGANIGALPTAAGAQVLDADDVGVGAEHFHWLPPIEAATVSGAFDGALDPSIRICRLPNTGCTTPLVQFTRTSSPAIVVNATAQSYSVSWSTKPSNITLGDYRAEVWIATRRLGFADVRVVASAKDLKNVPSGFAGVQTGKAIDLPFRLEQGIIASVSVTPVNPGIDSAYTQQLTATVRDFRGDPISPEVPVTWASVSPAIATVTSTGLVKGITLGKTIITATTAAGIAGIDTVEVVRPAIAQIVVNPSGAEVAVGDTTRVWATAFDSRGGILPRQVTYSSSNTAVATVSQTGLVTGVAVGTVTISAT